MKMALMNISLRYKAIFHTYFFSPCSSFNDEKQGTTTAINKTYFVTRTRVDGLSLIINRLYLTLSKEFLFSWIRILNPK